MTEHMVQFWPVGKPLPDGWRIIDDLSDCHHGVHGVMIAPIVRELPNENPKHEPQL